MNTFKYAFFTVTAVVMVSGCASRGDNPYTVQSQNNGVDEVGELISNNEVETIIMEAK